jgi:hypothetical protein
MSAQPKAVAKSRKQAGGWAASEYFHESPPLQSSSNEQPMERMRVSNEVSATVFGRYQIRTLGNRSGPHSGSAVAGRHELRDVRAPGDCPFRPWTRMAVQAGHRSCPIRENMNRPRYRKAEGESGWHFCSNCSQWPQLDAGTLFS